MAVLWPLSAIAVWMANDAYARGDASAIWVAVALPPLFALYALWARLPALHTPFRAGVTSAVFGAVIAFFTLAPLVAATRAALPDPERDARLEAAGKAQEEQRAREQQAQLDRQEAEFANLGPDSPLEDYLIYLSSMTYEERALAGIRQVKNRQADAMRSCCRRTRSTVCANSGGSTSRPRRSSARPMARRSPPPPARSPRRGRTI